MKFRFPSHRFPLLLRPLPVPLLGLQALRVRVRHELRDVFVLLTFLFGDKRDPLKLWMWVLWRELQKALLPKWHGRLFMPRLWRMVKPPDEPWNLVQDRLLQRSPRERLRVHTL